MELIMIVKINVKSLGSRKKIAPVDFDYSPTPPTLRELITQTVRICVREYNKKVLAGQDGQKVLSQEDIRKFSEIGKIAFGIVYSDKIQDEKSAILNALQSFNDGLYRVFLDNSELPKLDSEINLKEGDSLTFIRLTMLTGRMW